MDLEEAKTHLGKIIGEEFTLYAGFLNDTLAHLALDSSTKVLDIGTGWGVMAIVLALNGFEVLTGEPDHTAGKWEKEGIYIEHQEQHHGVTVNWRTAARAVGVDHKIKFQHLDAEHLPFADDSFDAVFLNGTLHHLQNKSLALAECLRVTTPNGVVTVIEGNKNAPEFITHKHATVYTLDDPRDFLPRNDISVEIITGDRAQAYFLRKKPCSE